MTAATHTTAPAAEAAEAIKDLRALLARKRAARPPLPSWMAPIKNEKKSCQRDS